MIPLRHIVIVMFGLAFCVTILAGEPNQVVKNIFDELLRAVEHDENQRYRDARAKALQLDDDAFGLLLQSLGEVGTWRALSVRGGLRVRRTQPELSGVYDKTVDNLRDNPWQDPGGYWHFGAGRWPREWLRPEHDALTFEAMLTETARYPAPPADREHTEARVPFRYALLLRIDGSNPDYMPILLDMLRDPPDWILVGSVAAQIYVVARDSGVDMNQHIPTLVEAYKQTRQKKEIFGTPIYLLNAIGRTGTETALPAYIELRKFERIQMIRDGLTPWLTTEEEIEARNQLIELYMFRHSHLQTQWEREGRPDDLAGLIEKMEQELAEMRRKRDSLYGSRRVWHTLVGFIEEHEGRQ